VKFQFHCLFFFFLEGRGDNLVLAKVSLGLISVGSIEFRGVIFLEVEYVLVLW